jgi:hypothetical protein
MTPPSRQPREVRHFLVVAILLSAFASTRAQDQEGKLVNRLLRPDTELRNADQNKKFSADRVSVEKRARVGTFYLQGKATSKTYTNTRDFSATKFKSRSFDTSGTGNSLLAARSTNSMRSYDVPTARVSVNLRDSHRETPTSNFAGNRPFLETGKSQKSLERKNPPMTIDQVRELLNKN